MNHPEDLSRVTATQNDTPAAELGHSAIGQWGAVIAGAIGGLATTIVLATLGIALGVSAIDPFANATADEAAAFGIGAAVWTLLTAAIVGLVGGSVAARASRTDRPYHGPLLGTVTWGAGMALGALLASASSGAAVGGIGAAGAAMQAASAMRTTATDARSDVSRDPAGMRQVSDASLRRDAGAAPTASELQSRENAKAVFATAAWVALGSQLVALLFTILGASWQRRRAVAAAVPAGVADVRRT